MRIIQELKRRYVRYKLKKRGWFIDCDMTNASDEIGSLPWWEKYTLSVEEAAVYFRIGENKLRNLIRENKFADYILWNGNRPQIKRGKFEKFIDAANTI